MRCVVVIALAAGCGSSAAQQDFDTTCQKYNRMATACLEEVYETSDSGLEASLLGVIADCDSKGLGTAQLQEGVDLYACWIDLFEGADCTSEGALNATVDLTTCP